MRMGAQEAAAAPLLWRWRGRGAGSAAVSEPEGPPQQPRPTTHLQDGVDIEAHLRDAVDPH